MAHLQNYSIWFSRQKQTARPKTLLVEETPTNSVVAVVGCIYAHNNVYLYIYIYVCVCAIYGARYYFGCPFPKLLVVTHPFRPTRSLPRNVLLHNTLYTYKQVI